MLNINSADWTWKASFVEDILLRAKNLLIHEGRVTGVIDIDWMGERGMRFMDKQVPVSPQIVAQMNGIYERLWNEYTNMITFQ